MRNVSILTPSAILKGSNSLLTFSQPIYFRYIHTSSSYKILAMNKIFLGLGLLVAQFFTANVATAQNPYPSSEYGPPQDQDVSYQNFYDELQPYGRWVDYPSYGYVWVPTAGADFTPYSTNGHWVYSTVGWTWVSDYNWGWAPFHYGRWFQDAAYGWAWIPGYEWAPAWVSWRQNDEYYGWAPLQPNFQVGVSVNFGSISINAWNFLPRQYMCQPNFRNYYLGRDRNVTIINNTTIINNYSRGNYGRNRNFNYYSGPNSRDVERATRQRINPVNFENSNRPGADRMNGNRLAMYRPDIRNDNNRGFAPRSFERNGQTINRGQGRDDRNPGRNNGFDNNNNLGNNRPNANFDRADAGNNRPNPGNHRPDVQNGNRTPERSNNGWGQNNNRPVNTPDRTAQPGMNQNQNWGNRDRQNQARPDNNGGTFNRPERQPRQEQNNTPTPRPAWQNNQSNNQPNNRPQAVPRTFNNDRPQMQNREPRMESRPQMNQNRGGGRRG